MGNTFRELPASSLFYALAVSRRRAGRDVLDRPLTPDALGAISHLNDPSLMFGLDYSDKKGLKQGPRSFPVNFNRLSPPLHPLIQSIGRLLRKAVSAACRDH